MLTPEQIEPLAAFCNCEPGYGLGGTIDYYLLPDTREPFAEVGDEGSALTLAGERIAMEKLGWDLRCHGEPENPRSWEYSITTWDDDTEFYPTLSQAIEAACIEWVNGRKD